jgi:hypothetical protein
MWDFSPESDARKFCPFDSVASLRVSPDLDIAAVADTRQDIGEGDLQ